MKLVIVFATIALVGFSGRLLKCSLNFFYEQLFNKKTPEFRGFLGD